MNTYNPNYYDRHSFELHARLSAPSKPEPVQEEEEEEIEYFDVDYDMKWYRLDPVSPLNHDRREVHVKKPFKRAVIQMDLEGNYITTHSSAKAAADSVGGSYSSITMCARGEKYNHVKGYKWAYQKNEAA